MSITEKRLTEIQARTEAATDGPWDRWAGWDDRDNSVAGGGREDAPTVADVIPEKDDAVFIAHAREDVPDLLAEVERLRVENKQLRARLTVDDEMVERAVETHRETFNAWHVKRNLEDAENRRVAAMRAAMDAALNPYEQEDQ